MFRELERKNKKIPHEDCIEILVNERRGILSVNGDEGYPYCMPMNHYYNSKDGCIYFHCGKQEGHRLDALNKDNKVCFCVCEKGHIADGDWALTVRSVVIFGRIEIIDCLDEIVEITTALSLKFTSDTEYIKKEIKAFGPKTLLLKLVPEHVCGKTVKES